MIKWWETSVFQSVIHSPILIYHWVTYYPILFTRVQKFCWLSARLTLLQTEGLPIYPSLWHLQVPVCTMWGLPGNYLHVHSMSFLEELLFQINVFRKQISCPTVLLISINWNYTFKEIWDTKFMVIWNSFII